MYYPPSYSDYQVELLGLFERLLFEYEEAQHDLSFVILNLLAGEMPLAPLPPIAFHIPDEEDDEEDEIEFEDNIFDDGYLLPNPPPPRYYVFDAMKTFGKYE